MSQRQKPKQKPRMRWSGEDGEFAKEKTSEWRYNTFALL